MRAMPPAARSTDSIADPRKKEPLRVRAQAKITDQPKGAQVELFAALLGAAECRHLYE